VVQLTIALLHFAWLAQWNAVCIQFAAAELWQPHGSNEMSGISSVSIS